MVPGQPLDVVRAQSPGAIRQGPILVARHERGLGQVEGVVEGFELGLESGSQAEKSLPVRGIVGQVLLFVGIAPKVVELVGVEVGRVVLQGDLGVGLLVDVQVIGGEGRVSALQDLIR